MGRHTGADKAAQTPRPPRQKILVLAFCVTALLVAWGVLVFAAIDFGGEARAGEPTGWVFLALATVGAAACLFATLLLGTRIVTIISKRNEPPEAAPAPRPAGGRRRRVD